MNVDCAQEIWLWMKDGSFIKRSIEFKKVLLFCFVLRMVDTLKYLNADGKSERGMNKLKLEETEESAINPGPWTVRRDGNGYLDWEILYRNEGDSICLVSSTWSALLDA